MGCLDLIAPDIAADIDMNLGVVPAEPPKGSRRYPGERLSQASHRVAMEDVRRA